MTNTQLSIKDLQVIDDEPVIPDTILGSRLEFSRANDIRKIIERNTQELSMYSTLRHRVATEQCGCVKRQIKTYYLNEPQALLLCMFSRTARAAQVRKELIEVYMAYRTRGLAKVREHYRALPNPAARHDDDASDTHPQPTLPPFRPASRYSPLPPDGIGGNMPTVDEPHRYHWRMVSHFDGAGVYLTHKCEMYQVIGGVDKLFHRVFNRRKNCAEGPAMPISLEEFNAHCAAKLAATTSVAGY